MRQDAKTYRRENQMRVLLITRSLRERLVSSGVLRLECAGFNGDLIRTAFQADPVPDKRASRSIIRGINAMQKGSGPGGQGPGGLRLLHCRLDGLEWDPEVVRLFHPTSP